MGERGLQPGFWLSSIWVERHVLVGLVVAHISMGLGVAWDVHWHWVVGRESFWLPPHMLLYPGAALAGILGVFIIICRASAEEGPLRARLRSLLSQGYGSVGLGSAVMVTAAGFDDVWHRTLGDRTIWSPPHVMGVAGGVLITLGIPVALFRAGRRQILPPLWAQIGVVYLLATLLVAADFGVRPAAIMEFFPDARGLHFFITTPYLVSGLASLMLPGMLSCSQQVLGRRGFEIVATAAIVLWGAQQALQSVATPFVAGLYGYAIKAHVVPDLQFELLILGFVLMPALVVSRYLTIHQPWIAGAVLAGVYTAEVMVWLGILELAQGATGLPMLGVMSLDALKSAPAIITLGALSSTAGGLCGRGIRHAYLTCPSQSCDYPWA